METPPGRSFLLLSITPPTASPSGLTSCSPHSEFISEFSRALKKKKKSQETRAESGLQQAREKIPQQKDLENKFDS